MFYKAAATCVRKRLTDKTITSIRGFRHRSNSHTYRRKRTYIHRELPRAMFVDALLLLLAAGLRCCVFTRHLTRIHMGPPPRVYLDPCRILCSGGNMCIHTGGFEGRNPFQLGTEMYIHMPSVINTRTHTHTHVHTHQQLQCFESREREREQYMYNTYKYDQSLCTYGNGFH